MGTWLDNDGLYHKYGTTKTTANVAGEFQTLGALREIEVKLDLTTLTSSAVIISDVTFFPKMRIEEVVIEVQTAATSSGTGTLDVGLIKTDRTTEIDYNGLIAAETTADLDTAGKKITYIYGTSKAGALIGTTTTSVGHITANYNTGAFQAGVVYIRIRYRHD